MTVGGVTVGGERSPIRSGPPSPNGESRCREAISFSHFSTYFSHSRGAEVQALAACRPSGLFAKHLDCSRLKSYRTKNSFLFVGVQSSRSEVLMRRRTAIASALASILAVGAMSLSGVTVAGASPSHHAAKGVTIRFTHGHPTLKGMNIALVNAAGSAHRGDTNVHDLIGYLLKWGAAATQANAPSNDGELAVESGKAQVVAGPLPTEVDAGLVVFGPNQTAMTYEILAKPTITTLSDLKGKSFAYANTAAPTGPLLSIALKKAHLTRSQLHLVSTGASAASLTAVLSGEVDAAFVHTPGLPSAAKRFHALITSAELAPKLATTFMAARGSWLKSHRADAVAFDLAWLASAKLFNTNESAWVKNSEIYTSYADPASSYKAEWKALKIVNGWPVSLNAYSAGVVKYNLATAKASGALKGPGLRPASKEITVSAWQTAWKLFKKHEKSL